MRAGRKRTAEGGRFQAPRGGAQGACARDLWAEQHIALIAHAPAPQSVGPRVPCPASTPLHLGAGQQQYTTSALAHALALQLKGFASARILSGGSPGVCAGSWAASGGHAGTLGSADDVLAFGELLGPWVAAAGGAAVAGIYVAPAEDSYGSASSQQRCRSLLSSLAHIYMSCCSMLCAVVLTRDVCICTCRSALFGCTIRACADVLCSSADPHLQS